MSDRLGPVSYKTSEEDPFLGREIQKQRQFSEHTMELIDEEVASILHDASETARRMLSERRSQLDRLASALLQEEELDEKQITELIGPSAHARAKADERDGVAVAVKGSLSGASNVGRTGKERPAR